MPDARQVNENIVRDSIHPIFADGFLVSFRIRAKNAKHADSKLEDATPIGGLIEIVFVDESRQQPLGRFIIDRTTAEELSIVLNDSIKKFDSAMSKGGLSGILPKKEAKSGNDPSYR